MNEEEYFDWNDILKENNQINIIVSINQLKNILLELGNDVDEEGFVIDTSTKQRVESYDLDNIKLKGIGVLSSGSKVFVKDTIANFSQYLSEKEK